MSEDLEQLFNKAEQERQHIQRHQRKLQSIQQKIQDRLEQLDRELHERNDDSLITINQATEIMKKSRQSVSRYIREGRIKKRAGKLLKSEVKKLKRKLKQMKGFSLIHDPIHFSRCGKQADRKQSHEESIIRITDIEFHL